MPKASVLVPVYNVEKYIRRCLTSIQNQTMTDIEIIVVNDGTTDHSMEIVHELAKEDQRIKILNHEKNMGLMWTRRTGYMAATGDYISFCDSDDYMPPKALEILYSTAIESDADIVSGCSEYFTVTGEKFLWQATLEYGYTKEGVLKSLLRGGMNQNLWGRLYKASLFKDYDYKTFMHATNGEDGCLFYQIIDKIKRIVLIEDVVYYYMQNEASSTQVQLNENAIKSICLLNKIREEIVEPYPELHEDLKRCITNKLCALYIMGYKKKGSWPNKYIAKNGLKKYVTLYNIIRYLNYYEMIKLLVRS